MSHESSTISTVSGCLSGHGWASEEDLRSLAGLITPTPPIRPPSAVLHLQAASKLDYDSSPTAPRQPSEGDGTEPLLSAMIQSDVVGQGPPRHCGLPSYFFSSVHMSVSCALPQTISLSTLRRLGEMGAQIASKGIGNTCEGLLHILTEYGVLVVVQYACLRGRGRVFLGTTGSNVQERTVPRTVQRREEARRGERGEGEGEGEGEAEGEGVDEGGGRGRGEETGGLPPLLLLDRA